MCKRPFRDAHTATQDSALCSPMAQRPPAPRGAGEIRRPRLARRRHAKARDLTAPFHHAELDGVLGLTREVVIVNFDGVRGFVYANHGTEDQLSAEADGHPVAL